MLLSTVLHVVFAILSLAVLFIALAMSSFGTERWEIMALWIYVLTSSLSNLFRLLSDEAN